MEKDKEIVIYYFSATGNSLKLSLDIASHFDGTELLNIASTRETEPTEAPMVGFVFPVYMGGLPNIVREFLQNFTFKKEVYYFAIGTYYLYKGCAMSIVSKIISDKGASLTYSNCLPSVGNCLKEYEVSPKKRTKILSKSENYTTDIINDLKNKAKKKTPKYFRLSDNIHKSLFNAFFSKPHQRFTLENTCVSCRVCERICPVNNITFKDGVPQWGTKCEFCHACVHWCPQNAINIGKSKGRLQYQHPAIERSMLSNKKE